MNLVALLLKEEINAQWEQKILTKESTNSNAIVHVLEFCMNRLSPMQCQEIDIQEESIILTYYVHIKGQNS